jgi:hypothetical protein
MYLNFTGRNGNQLYRKALYSVLTQGEPVSPKGRRTLEIQGITTILEPRERILTMPGRAANPFFNVAENLAIIAGLKNQRDWFLQFNKQYVEVAHDSPTDEASWGFYGTRLRNYIHGPKRPSEGHVGLDQLKEITKKLEVDRFSRQAVASLWHPYLDNEPGHKDYPCNWGVMFKIRDRPLPSSESVLHMTVVNRSNDIHWGLFGVNLNQWSFIQEVLAAVLGVEIGHQIHVSDSLHLYLDEPWATITKNMAGYNDGFDVYEHAKPEPMFIRKISWETIDGYLESFFKVWNGKYIGLSQLGWNEWPFLYDAWHFLKAYTLRKEPMYSWQDLLLVKDNALWVSGVEYLARKPKFMGEVTGGRILGEVEKRFKNTTAIMQYILTANIVNQEKEPVA